MTMQSRGRPRGWRAPNPHCVMVNVRLTVDETTAVDAFAVKARRSRSEIIRTALQHYLRKETQES